MPEAWKIRALAGIPVLIVVLWVAACRTPAPAAAPTRIRPQEVQDLLDFNTPILVVDVREPEEFCAPAGHLPGARNYPWSSGALARRYPELPPQAPIVVVCRSGRRSALATDFLRAHGYHQALNMVGGMKQWSGDRETCPDASADAHDETPTSVEQASQ